ncbi:LuxR C-terminal-related transcriptional regulator [Limibacter armeniacum]|uniref:LuxR C-terminal-related transcriptional regulator n=1 Tax=Limibacter armeniacum TaxID=466084 RepID=UPI002FE59F42
MNAQTTELLTINFERLVNQLNFDTNLAQYKDKLAIESIVDNFSMLPGQSYYIIDLHKGQIHDCSNELIEFLGIPHHSLSIAQLFSLIHHKDQSKLIDQLSEIILSKYPHKPRKEAEQWVVSRSFEVYRKNRGYCRVIESITPLAFDRHNYPVFWLCTWSSDTSRYELSVEKNLEGSFTEREKEIISLLAEGKNSKDIAEELVISSHTVDTHRRKMLSKLGLNNVTQLVAFAFKIGLLT